MSAPDQALLTVLGGAGTVTGSKYLLTADGSDVMVDCGLFQGLKALRLRNWEPLPLDPGSVRSVVLTHAHLDHCGYLPALVRQGFGGPVYASAATTQLAAIVLRDSGHLQEEDAAYAAKRGFSKHSPPQPLYTEDDAARAAHRLQAVPFGTSIDLAPAVSATLQPAGHILGSSSVLVQAAGRRVVFSGDLGRSSHPLLLPPPPPPAADVVLVESTYGDRRHDDSCRDRFVTVARETLQGGGTVLVPAFAVDRTEVLLTYLRELIQAGELPQVPVYVDSPMALAALRVYREALTRHDPELRPELADGGDPFDPGTLEEAATPDESRALNNPRWPSIIVSASGMATGGRVLHHLEHLLPDPRNAVVLVGFQAAGTRGRSLQEGVRSLKMHGRYVPVRARIVDVPAFSVHADQDELVGWLSGMPAPPDLCLVVHGEPDSSAALRTRIEQELGWTAVVPRDGEKVRLD